MYVAVHVALIDECQRQVQKIALIEALNQHGVNTMGGLRQIERTFAELGSWNVTELMTAACMHPPPSVFIFSSMIISDVSIGVYYVNSNNLFSELRSLTRNYPFRYGPRFEIPAVYSL